MFRNENDAKHSKALAELIRSYTSQIHYIKRLIATGEMDAIEGTKEINYLSKLRDNAAYKLGDLAREKMVRR